MKSVAFLAGGAALVAAYPQLAPRIAELEKRQDPNPWIAPGAGDVRCPCPGTNTLANHGFINRNGTGITMQALQQGFLDAFGFAFDATAPGATNAINLCGQITGTTCTAFDLNMLDVPHAIEHDASMRADDANMTFNQMANDAAFNQTIWDMTLAFWGDATHLDVSLSNSARLGRQGQAQQQDFPGWFVPNNGGSQTEHAFLLTAFDDPTNEDPSNPQARIDWINELITGEQLPTSLGWSSSTVISSSYLNDIVNSVGSATTEAPPSKRGLPLLSVATNPASTDQVSSAVSKARANAGPAPTLVNPYTTILSAEEWNSQITDVESYINQVTNEINSLLGTIGL